LHLHEAVFGDGWPAAPVWSPDGEWLAFTAWAQDRDQAGVWVVRTDGQQGEEYQSLFTEYHLGGSDPVWVSDGRWLAFHRALDDGGTSSWVAQVGTWGLVRLALPPDAYVVDWISPSSSCGPPRPVVRPSQARPVSRYTGWTIPREGYAYPATTIAVAETSVWVGFGSCTGAAGSL